MEHGDIVKYKDKCYMVLRTEDKCLYCLGYDFINEWICEDECVKVGSSDAIFKVMYEIMSCELKILKG